jgi:hypothetical protein
MPSVEIAAVCAVQGNTILVKHGPRRRLGLTTKSLDRRQMKTVSFLLETTTTTTSIAVA